MTKFKTIDWVYDSTYQWFQADTNSAISGATASSYTPVAGDLAHTLKCNVTAINASGSVAAPSNTSGAVVAPAAPANTVAPALSTTTPVPGAAISVCPVRRVPKQTTTAPRTSVMSDGAQ